MTGILLLAVITACNHGKTPDSVNVKSLSTGFIYEMAPFPQCHASTLTETSEGFLVAWFGGTHEKNPDVCIYVSALTNGKWDLPRQVAGGVVNDTLRYPTWNPVLFTRDNGDVVLYYKIGPSPREWWGAYRISTDNGKSWSEEIRISEPLLGPIKNKPVRLGNGTLLFPSSTETREIWKIHAEISDQNMSGWEMIEIDNNGFNAIQPTVLFHKEGRLQMLCRSKEKRIVETWSSDQGKSWTPLQATALVNNNSGIDGVTLKTGLHLLVCNPLEKGRNKLGLFASPDGKEWREILLLENQPEGEFSYPAIIEAKDGTIHITYTWNRTKVKYHHLELE